MCRLKPDGLSSWEEEIATKSHPLVKSHGQFISVMMDSQSCFFKTVDLDELITLQRKSTHPRIYGQHKLDLMGLKERERRYKVGGTEKGLSWEDLGER